MKVSAMEKKAKECKVRDYIKIAPKNAENGTIMPGPASGERLSTKEEGVRNLLSTKILSRNDLFEALQRLKILHKRLRSSRDKQEAQNIISGLHDYMVRKTCSVSTQSSMSLIVCETIRNPVDLSKAAQQTTIDHLDDDLHILQTTSELSQPIDLAIRSKAFKKPIVAGRGAARKRRRGAQTWSAGAAACYSLPSDYDLHKVEQLSRMGVNVLDFIAKKEERRVQRKYGKEVMLTEDSQILHQNVYTGSPSKKRKVSKSAKDKSDVDIDDRSDLELGRNENDVTKTSYESPLAPIYIDFKSKPITGQAVAAAFTADQAGYVTLDEFRSNLISDETVSLDITSKENSPDKVRSQRGAVGLVSAKDCGAKHTLTPPNIDVPYSVTPLAPCKPSTLSKPAKVTKPGQKTPVHSLLKTEKRKTTDQPTVLPELSNPSKQMSGKFPKIILTTNFSRQNVITNGQGEPKDNVSEAGVSLTPRSSHSARQCVVLEAGVSSTHSYLDTRQSNTSKYFQTDHHYSKLSSSTSSATEVPGLAQDLGCGGEPHCGQSPKRRVAKGIEMPGPALRKRQLENARRARILMAKTRVAKARQRWILKPNSRTLVPL